jgi:hypothetical protein
MGQRAAFGTPRDEVWLMTMAGDGAVGQVSLRRSFAWGVFFIGDSKADVVEVNPDVAVTWGREDEALAVGVRHAMDVDDQVLDALDDDEEVPWVEVTVNVHWGGPSASRTDGDGLIDVPSGVVTIGDANFEDVFALPPGRWRVQLSLEPHDNAEHVDVWLSPAG